MRLFAGAPLALSQLGTGRFGLRMAAIDKQASKGAQLLLDADLFIIWGFPWTGNPQFMLGLEWKNTHEDGWFGGAPILGNIHYGF